MSEFFAAELVVVLDRGRGTANHLHFRGRGWRENLPARFAALARGEPDLARTAGLADVLGHTTPELARAVDAWGLPGAGSCRWPGSRRVHSRTFACPLPDGAVDDFGVGPGSYC